MSHHCNGNQSIWKGYLAGMAGGAAGVLAMDAYNRLTTRLGAPSMMQPPKQGEHDMSLAGRQYREGESATAALGRMLYRKVRGREPDEATKAKLSYGIHWSYGMDMAGIYGMVRGCGRIADIPAGLAFGAALWALGDMVGVPLLGLSEGPKAYPKTFHAETLGAHLAYGVAAAVTTQLVHRALVRD
jgi:hypothetical protein